MGREVPAGGVACRSQTAAGLLPPRALPIEPFPPKQNPSPFSDRLLGVRRTDLDGALGALGALRGNSRFGRQTGYGFGPFGFESFEFRAFGFGALTSGTEFPQWNNPKNRPLRTPSGPDS